MLPGTLSNRALGEKVVEELSLPGRGRIVGEKKWDQFCYICMKAELLFNQLFFFFK